jgi:hypothetical protein
MSSGYRPTKYRTVRNISYVDRNRLINKGRKSCSMKDEQPARNLAQLAVSLDGRSANKGKDYVAIIGAS